ncbi:MAG: FecR domain-containing protein [Sandaracinaceae bacterium]|nr:FecR domain-containing protein [Sandaracinaceae bacterium]
MKKLPLEPLDEAAWARVEARVLATPTVPTATPAPSARGRWLGGAALAVAAAALVLGVWARLAVAPGDTARVTSIATDAAPSVVRLGEIRLDVAPESELVAHGAEANGVRLVLARGAVTCTVPPRAGRPPFVVEAGTVEVEVVGTRFTVRRDPEVEVEVERGSVRVRAAGGAHELGAGQRWSAAHAPSAASAARETSRDVAPADPSPIDPGAEARAANEAAPETSAIAPRPALDPAAEFARASALEARDPDRADALYRRVERAGGPWAANSLFARARLAADRGRTAPARRLAADYLRRHPDGLNAADARRLLATLEGP